MNKTTEFTNAIHDSKLRSKGWDNLVIYAQAYLESGMFESDLAKIANNFWGIKWVNGSDYGYYEKKTKEFEDGKEIIIVARFKKYPNCEEALKDYTRMIEKHYEYSFLYRGDYEKFYRGLQVGTQKEPWRKWSTSPTYASNLIEVYKKLRTPELWLILNEYKV